VYIGQRVRCTILPAMVFENHLKVTKVLDEVLLVHLGQFVGGEGGQINFGSRHAWGKQRGRGRAWRETSPWMTCNILR
jgi:hypothetical protein